MSAAQWRGARGARWWRRAPWGTSRETRAPPSTRKPPPPPPHGGNITLPPQHLNPPVDTKTLYTVFVHPVAPVHSRVFPDKVYAAFYRLDRPTVQITAYVFDVVRARVPKMELDDLFDRKDEIAIAVKQELSAEMDSFGYLIVQALVTDIDPDKKVKESMNEINAAKRLRVAATELSLIHI